MVRQNYPPGCPMGGKFFDKKGLILLKKPRWASFGPLSIV